MRRLLLKRDGVHRSHAPSHVLTATDGRYPQPPESQTERRQIGEHSSYQQQGDEAEIAFRHLALVCAATTLEPCEERGKDIIVSAVCNISPQ